MAEVLHSPSHLPSSPSPPSRALSCSSNHESPALLTDREERKRERRTGREEEEDQFPFLALLLTVVRKSLAGCRAEGEEDPRSMEIGWPTDVRHVAHVTFDRFHGFLGLPVEFEPEVPRRAPSASANVFGVSTESMQCSYDCRGNSVPTILLLMQRRLYEQGGLRAEGIFRINAENSQEEYLRDQLNSGIVPDGIDVHCLAGLIKAWFRELPTGVLDPLTPEQVMQCQSEEESAQVVKLLPPTEAALLNWAINLMADVVQEEQTNKMNAHNVAMVFAPNMTQMADPLTALMYAVKVMNFLKMLILKTLKERQESTLEDTSVPHSDPSDDTGHHAPQLPLEACTEEPIEQEFIPEEPVMGNLTQPPEESSVADDAAPDTCETSEQNAVSDETAAHFPHGHLTEIPSSAESSTRPGIADSSLTTVHIHSRRTRTSRSSSRNHRKGTRKANAPSPVQGTTPAEKSRGASIVSRINSKVERAEAWR